jgi:hypothetical protein
VACSASLIDQHFVTRSSAAVVFRHAQHAVQARFYCGGTAAGQHAERGAGRQVRMQLGGNGKEEGWSL